MKNLISFFIVIIIAAIKFDAGAQTKQPVSTSTEINTWFAKKEWLGGVHMQPHKSINKTELAKQYQLNKIYWDKAFAFLKNNDLESMAPGKYAIDGDNVYATITENKTKYLDSTKWEAHRNYIDLQSVITGEEKIGVAPVETLAVAMPYDASKDLANYSGEGIFYDAFPGAFFLFFPGDAHRPNITTNRNKPDKKIVIKIRYSQ